VSVTIVVGPGSAGAEPSRCYSSLIGDIFKFTVAEVVIECVAAVASDVNIGQAVIVVIGDGHAHAPPFPGEPSSLGNIGEFEAIVLVIKRDHEIAALLIAVDG